MDIHPPHAIRSWKDFFVQLGTITAGILIALSLEGIRESMHNRSLVAEARDNIRRELQDNKREVDGELAQVAGRESKVSNALASSLSSSKSPAAPAKRTRRRWARRQFVTAVDVQSCVAPGRHVPGALAASGWRPDAGGFLKVDRAVIVQN